jgi:hypothetical protein
VERYNVNGKVFKDDSERKQIIIKIEESGKQKKS